MVPQAKFFKILQITEITLFIFSVINKIQGDFKGIYQLLAFFKVFQGYQGEIFFQEDTRSSRREVVTLSLQKVKFVMLHIFVLLELENSISICYIIFVSILFK